MKKTLRVVAWAAGGLVIAAAAGAAQTADGGSADAARTAASANEQVQQLEQSCVASAEARAARHAERPLFERLGGEPKIHALITEVVRRHKANDAIAHYFENVDTDQLVSRVTQFLSVGSGGPGAYTGRDMRSAHAHMRLTNADFLAAGGDIEQAMKSLGYAGDEIEEVICSVVPLRPEVIASR